jgi:hypothetical protein
MVYGFTDPPGAVINSVGPEQIAPDAFSYIKLPQTLSMMVSNKTMTATIGANLGY